MDRTRQRSLVDEQQIVDEIDSGLFERGAVCFGIAVLSEPRFPTSPCDQVHHVRLMVEHHESHDVARLRREAGGVEFRVERLQRSRRGPCGLVRGGDRHIAHVNQGTDVAGDVPAAPPRVEVLRLSLENPDAYVCGSSGTVSVLMKKKPGNSERVPRQVARETAILSPELGAAAGFCSSV